MFMKFISTNSYVNSKDTLPIKVSLMPSDSSIVGPSVDVSVGNALGINVGIKLGGVKGLIVGAITALKEKQWLECMLY